jgi:hypothetical protein
MPIDFLRNMLGYWFDFRVGKMERERAKRMKEGMVEGQQKRSRSSAGETAGVPV